MKMKLNNGLKISLPLMGVIINNAAFAPAAFPALLNSYDLIKKTYELNVLGSFTLINEVAKHMIKKKFGRIISFSSMSVELNQEAHHYILLVNQH